MNYTKFEIDLSDVKEVPAHNGKEVLAFRIIAKRDINNPYRTIRAGEKGGYVAVNTLSQEGECWVDEESTIGPGCYISGDAFVSESNLVKNICVGNSALISESIMKAPSKASIYGGAKIIDSATIGDINISGEAKIEHSTVLGKLDMSYGAQLIGCNIEAKNEGISIQNDTVYRHKNIIGSGAIFNDNVKIKEISNAKRERLY